MTIYFKNGMTLDIIDEIAESICKNIIKGTKSFQIFSDEDTGEIVLVVNLEEIVYIK